MNVDTLRIAFRLKHLIENKHNFSRSLDHSTRQLVELITTRQLKPDRYDEEHEYTSKEEFQKDLTTFGQGMYWAAVPQVHTIDTLEACIRLAVEPITAEMSTFVEQAVNKAVLPEIIAIKASIQAQIESAVTSAVTKSTPSLLQVRSATRTAVEQVLPDAMLPHLNYLHQETTGNVAILDFLLKQAGGTYNRSNVYSQPPRR